jgi:uncharacterized membrane protein
VQVTIAVVTAIGLMLTLPERVANHPRWVLPALATVLLIGVFVARTARFERRLRRPPDDEPDLAPVDWEPGFVDYLYVSFTNAMAFSPTDVMPMTRWAKLTMLTQSVISVVTLVLVVARAVNILAPPS